MRWLFLVLLLTAIEASAEPRGGTNEWSLNLLVVGTKHYAFEGGAAARNDGGAGIGLTVTRNLNDYFAVGADATLSTFGYRARVAPGTGNAGAGYDAEGDMETGALRMHATWNLLAQPLTPFLTAGVGVIFLDTDRAIDPPANACWVYPFYGQVCGAKAPTNALARLTYGAGAGLRFELPQRQGFIRAFVSGEWIEIPQALSSVGYVQFRTDWGIRF